MLGLKSKKGFSLIEVICSMAILMIMLAVFFNISSNAIALKKYNIELENNITFLEGLKNNIRYNMSCEEVLELWHNNKLYIHGENLNLEALKNKSIRSIFSSDQPEKKPYLVMNIEESRVLEIHMNLYSNLKNKKIFNFRFYMGKYI